jgi:hypothetical protein
MLGRRRGWVGDGTVVADGKPEFVLETLGMEEVAVVRPFVLVLDQKALRIVRGLGFAGGFGGDVVDGAEGGFGVFHLADRERQSENQYGDEQQKAECVLLHSAAFERKSTRRKRRPCPDGAMIVRIGPKRTEIGGPGSE